MPVESIEQQGAADLVGNVARVTLSVQYHVPMLSVSIMATETIAEGSRTKGRSFRMGWIPGFTIGRHMATWDHNGIALDRLIVYDTGMTGRTAFALPANHEGLHMSAMTHDQPDLLHR